jgi:cellulose synthase/poly-beta-1,6-N-acetylglucosamine synthase-like glycosyltransferase
METIFWGSLLLIVYVYAGYPALLLLWSRVAGEPVRKRPLSRPTDWPSVSVIIAARNEAARLPGRIENVLEQHYRGQLEIIVVSDGSTDGTAEALAGFADRIRLIEVAAGGKAAALNAGAAVARGEILVFADARQRFAPHAIAALASNFDDPRVGGATGELILNCERDGAASDSSIGESVGLYWRYEKWLRRHESLVRSTLGATGAIYALRQSLWRPLPPGALLDDVLAPMRAVLRGYRVVFEERAQAFDWVAPSAAAESARKIRTLAGNYQILAQEPALLVPFLNPVWLQYVSHKVGRLVVSWALLGLFISSIVLAPRSWLFAVALILQLGFYGLAAVGAWLESKGSPASTPTSGDTQGAQADAVAAEGVPQTTGGTRL